MLSVIHYLFYILLCAVCCIWFKLHVYLYIVFWIFRCNCVFIMIWFICVIACIMFLR